MLTIKKKKVIFTNTTTWQKLFFLVFISLIAIFLVMTTWPLAQLLNLMQNKIAGKSKYEVFVFDVPTGSSSMTINVWIFTCTGITLENISVSHKMFWG